MNWKALALSCLREHYRIETEVKDHILGLMQFMRALLVKEGVLTRRSLKTKRSGLSGSGLCKSCRRPMGRNLPPVRST